MEIVKKNIVSIVCGVIALVAIVGLFLVSGWYGDFGKKLDDSKSSNDAITQLMRQPRTIPTPDPGGNAVPLPVFPNDKVFEAGDKAMNQLHSNAQALLRAAVDLNAKGHDVLVHGALPRPSSTTEAFAFKDQYKRIMLPGGRPSPRKPGDPAVPENIPDGILRSAAPPTAMEIKQAMDKLWIAKYEDLVIKVDRPAAVPGQPATRTEVNRKDIEARFLSENVDFEKNFRSERATKYKIYMDPDALVMSAKMDPMGTAGGQAPTSEDMWYAQMGVWVQQDICRAIRDMNVVTGANVTGVQKSPIKHLISIDMPVGFDMYKTIGAGAPGAAPAVAAIDPATGAPLAGAPGAVAAPPEGEIPKVFTTSVTGRVCNSTYDVVHSTVTVVIDERSVTDFIHVLRAHGRMITVLDVDKVRVNNELSKDLGYDYGNAPVVRLTLKLEHLFMRGWTAHAANAPMPTEVKTYLGVQAPAVDPAAPPPVASRQ